MRILSVLRSDAAAYSATRTSVRIPSAFWLILGLRHPGFRMTLRWRVAKSLRSKIPFLPQLMRQSLITRYASDLSLDCNLGPGVRFPHPIGIVIGDNVEIGEDVTVMQHVTFGGNGREMVNGRQTPMIGKGAFVGPNSLVLGPVEVASGMFVKAGTVVTSKTVS